MRRPAVTLRPVGADDDAFLRELFLDARPELALLALTGHDALVELQFDAQRSQYAAAHPAAVDHVVVADDTAVGRCWTSATTGELRLLDLAVHSGFRRAGIGAAVIDELCRQAAGAQIPLRLCVWAANEPARRLYAAAGLHETGEVDGYVHMERSVPRVDRNRVGPMEDTDVREAVLR